MENSIVFADYREPFSFKLECARVEDSFNRWSRSLDILFILNGNVDLFSQGSLTSLSEEDVCVCNEGIPYSLESQGGAEILWVSFDAHALLEGERTIYFDCNSAGKNQGEYYALKHLIAKLVKINTEGGEENKLLSGAILLRILDELKKKFVIQDTPVEGLRKYETRVRQILQYIDKHYRECITLGTLAKATGLSVPYLSNFFEKYIGVNFLTYYAKYRLDICVKEMLTTDKPIEDIALSNGFSDARSFSNAFKKKYNMVPSAYRKLQKDERQSPFYNINGQQEKDYGSALASLAKYLKSDQDNVIEHVEEKEDSYKALTKSNIDITRVLKPLKHNFKVFTSVARAKELLYKDVQDMLQEIQNMVHFEYIKFHGILSDDMLVYKEDRNGNATYSFVLIDKVLDFVLSLGLKPMIEFSFMPRDLVEENHHEVYASPFYIGAPKSYPKWAELIDAFMDHVIARYGIRKVRTWLYCAWNEPDTTTSMFGFEKDQDYYDLYKLTRDIVKKHSQLCKFGSPSMIFSYKLYQPWLKNFIAWCEKNDCRPDFINIHYYDNDFTNEDASKHSPANPAHSRLNMDPNAFGKAIEDIHHYFESCHIEDLPVYLTEWNLTVSHRNLLNDTVFKSCYLAKNLLENYDKLHSFGYWTLTDFLEETQPSPNEFHGGLGLYTYSKIKKPHFYIFEFLTKLGNGLIDQGEGYFISKKHGCIQIFLYNYEHFNHLFASGETYDMTYLNRYTPFSMLGKMDVALELIGFTAKKCRIVTRTINQQHGSAFDKWVEMGAPSFDEELIAYLKSVCIPELLIVDKEIADGRLQIKERLQPLETKFIEIYY